MLGYVVRRLLWVVVLLVAISILTFALFFMLPGDPAQQAAGRAGTPETLPLLRHRMGLDLPMWKQYLNFVHGPDLGLGATGILRWPSNLGYSFYNQEPVLQTILDRLPVTASLALGGCVLWLLLGFATGILAALRPRSLYDRAAMALALLGVSAPVFVTGLGLLYVFYFKLGWAPAPGYVPIAHNPLAWAAPPHPRLDHRGKYLRRPLHAHDAQHHARGRWRGLCAHGPRQRPDRTARGTATHGALLGHSRLDHARP